ncbi:MAG: acyltransferase [Chitinophagaceae bacterium]|nr:MAG: acyltransferase [Chitinophagaceae bacterium]
METKRKVESLGLLRGVAVLMVCFCHYANPLASGNALAGMFDAFHVYGKYGVQLFFVISGFVIPLSMDKARYSLSYYGKFLMKRIVRLHPPYIVALVITLVIVYFANKVRNEPFPEDVNSIIKCLFYLKTPSNNGVYWTLRVEMEYYLFMGLFFVLLKKFPRPTLAIGIPVAMLLSQLPGLIEYIHLFEFLLYFMIGMAAYIIYNRQDGSSLFEYFCILAIGAFTFIYDGWIPTFAALFAAAVILFYTGKGNKFLNFTGEISYSVYLLHFPIGIKLINLLKVKVHPELSIVLFLGALALILVIGYLFWRFIEKPSADWSNKIKYGTSKRPPKSLPVEGLT